MNATHNHGPIVDKPRQAPQHKVRKGQVPAIPYDWPHDSSFTPYTTALVIIDMQKDCTCPTIAVMSMAGLIYLYSLFA
jgi:hypothetical protein